MTRTPILRTPQELTRRQQPAPSDRGHNTAPATRGACVLLLDASGSMTGRKLAEAKDATAAFLQEARNGGQSAAVIAFGSTARLLVPFGASRAQTTAALAELNLLGSTDMAAALALARQFLDGAASPRRIVVVSDGMPNNPAATLEEAATLKNDGVDIHTVGIPAADEQFLTRLAGSAARSQQLGSETELPAALVNVARQLLLPPPNTKS